jgi:hypothetical protein
VKIAFFSSKKVFCGLVLGEIVDFWVDVDFLTRRLHLAGFH